MTKLKLYLIFTVAVYVFGTSLDLASTFMALSLPRYYETNEFMRPLLYNGLWVFSESGFFLLFCILPIVGYYMIQRYTSEHRDIWEFCLAMFCLVVWMPSLRRLEAGFRNLVLIGVL